MENNGQKAEQKQKSENMTNMENNESEEKNEKSADATEEQMYKAVNIQKTDKEDVNRKKETTAKTENDEKGVKKDGDREE